MSRGRDRARSRSKEKRKRNRVWNDETIQTILAAAPNDIARSVLLQNPSMMKALLRRAEKHADEDGTLDTAILKRILANDEGDPGALKESLRERDERLRVELQRAAEAERRLFEAQAKVTALALEKQTASLSALKAKEEATLYKLRLDAARRDMERADEMLKSLAAENEEMNEEAARTRSENRQLKLNAELERARAAGLAEGRRLGRLEGRRNGRAEVYGHGFQEGQRTNDYDDVVGRNDMPPALNSSPDTMDAPVTQAYRQMTEDDAGADGLLTNSYRHPPESNRSVDAGRGRDGGQDFIRIPEPELHQRESARSEALRQDAARKEAARQEAAQLEQERQEAARREAAAQQEAEAARREAERQEAARLEAAARQEAARLEEARREAEQREADRREAARQEAARREAARSEAVLEGARQEAARQEAAREEAEQQALRRQSSRGHPQRLDTMDGSFQAPTIVHNSASPRPHQPHQQIPDGFIPSVTEEGGRIYMPPPHGMTPNPPPSESESPRGSERVFSGHNQYPSGGDGSRGEERHTYPKTPRTGHTSIRSRGDGERTRSPAPSTPLSQMSLLAGDYFPPPQQQQQQLLQQQLLQQQQQQQQQQQEYVEMPQANIIYRARNNSQLSVIPEQSDFDGASPIMKNHSMSPAQRVQAQYESPNMSMPQPNEPIAGQTRFGQNQATRQRPRENVPDVAQRAPVYAYEPAPMEPEPAAFVPQNHTGSSAYAPTNQTGPTAFIPVNQTGSSAYVPTNQTGPSAFIPVTQTGGGFSSGGSTTGKLRGKKGKHKQEPSTSSVTPSLQVVPPSPETAPREPVLVPNTNYKGIRGVDHRSREEVNSDSDDSEKPREPPHPKPFRPPSPVEVSPVDARPFIPPSILSKKKAAPVMRMPEPVHAPSTETVLKSPSNVTYVSTLPTGPSGNHAAPTLSTKYEAAPSVRYEAAAPVHYKAAPPVPPFVPPKASVPYEPAAPAFVPPSPSYEAASPRRPFIPPSPSIRTYGAASPRTSYMPPSPSPRPYEPASPGPSFIPPSPSSHPYEPASPGPSFIPPSPSPRPYEPASTGGSGASRQPQRVERERSPAPVIRSAAPPASFIPSHVPKAFIPPKSVPHAAPIGYTAAADVYTSPDDPHGGRTPRTPLGRPNQGGGFAGLYSLASRTPRLRTSEGDGTGLPITTPAPMSARQLPMAMPTIVERSPAFTAFPVPGTGASGFAPLPESETHSPFIPQETRSPMVSPIVPVRSSMPMARPEENDRYTTPSEVELESPPRSPNPNRNVRHTTGSSNGHSKGPAPFIPSMPAFIEPRMPRPLADRVVPKLKPKPREPTNEWATPRTAPLEAGSDEEEDDYLTAPAITRPRSNSGSRDKRPEIPQTKGILKKTGTGTSFAPTGPSHIPPYMMDRPGPPSTRSATGDPWENAPEEFQPGAHFDRLTPKTAYSAFPTPHTIFQNMSPKSSIYDPTSTPRVAGMPVGSRTPGRTPGYGVSALPGGWGTTPKVRPMQELGTGGSDNGDAPPFVPEFIPPSPAGRNANLGRPMPRPSSRLSNMSGSNMYQAPIPTATPRISYLLAGSPAPLFAQTPRVTSMAELGEPSEMMTSNGAGQEAFIPAGILKTPRSKRAVSVVEVSDEGEPATMKMPSPIPAFIPEPVAAEEEMPMFGKGKKVKKGKKGKNACAACQNDLWVTWSNWSANCTSNITTIGQWPLDIPAQTEVPAWAYQNVTLSDTFLIADAQATTGIGPESTYPGTPTATVNPHSSSSSLVVATSVATMPNINPTPTQASSNSGGSKTPVGPIVGGVIGGIAVLFLLGVLIFLIMRNKRQHKAQSSMPLVDQQSHAGMTEDSSLPAGYGVSYPSPNGGLGSPQKLYDPADPSTFPGRGDTPASFAVLSDRSAVSHSAPTSTSYPTSQPTVSSSGRYTGAAEV
ncbi:hypothetical protein FRB98_000123 [Tulasnella sp. 332]|nr:hypothetical protein FRB98_000123 [Tulasnella sp. 332]